MDHRLIFSLEEFSIKDSRSTFSVLSEYSHNSIGNLGPEVGKMKVFLGSILIAVVAINFPSFVTAGNLCTTGHCPTDVDSTRVAAAPGWGSIHTSHRAYELVKISQSFEIQVQALSAKVMRARSILATYKKPPCQLSQLAEKISDDREEVKRAWTEHKSKIDQLDDTWRAYSEFTRGIRIQIDGRDLGPSRFELVENFRGIFKTMERFFSRPINDLMCKETEYHWIIANDRGFGWHKKRKPYLNYLNSELVRVRHREESKEGTESAIIDKIAIEEYRMKLYNSVGRREYLKKLRTTERKAEKLQRARKPRPGKKQEDVQGVAGLEGGNGQNQGIQEDAQQNMPPVNEEDKPVEDVSNGLPKPKPHLRNFHRFHTKPRLTTKVQVVQDGQNLAKHNDLQDRI